MVRNLGVLGVLCGVLASGCSSAPQEPSAEAAAASVQAPAGKTEPFGIGRFGVQGKTFTGLVLRDAYVVDIAAAAAEGNRQVPIDVQAIIEEYDRGVGNSLKAIVQSVGNRLTSNRPAYVYDLKSVDPAAPFLPRVALYARTNYLEHLLEGGGGITPQGMDDGQRRIGNQVLETPPDSIPGIWERPAGDRRQNPYLFLVTPSPSVFTGSTDNIHVPLQRSTIDYECEFMVVVGKTARRVPVAGARDVVFGYANTIDVSDRAAQTGSNWWMGKGQDTFKPFGPYVVPKEFIDAENTSILFTLNGTELQKDNTRSAIHSADEMVHYASNIHTLHPLDVITLGTPSGVGNARKPQLWMKPGDTAMCSHGGLGALTNPVVAEPTS